LRVRPYRYKLVQCPRCRMYQITEAFKEYKCIYCGYRASMARLWREGCIIYESDSYRDVDERYNMIIEDIMNRGRSRGGGGA